MEQDIFNLVVTVLGILVGWVLKTIWDAVRELQTADKGLVDRVNAIEVLVAGRYVTREELERMVEKLFARLDSISDRLNNKADR